MATIESRLLFNLQMFTLRLAKELTLMLYSISDLVAFYRVIGGICWSFEIKLTLALHLHLSGMKRSRNEDDSFHSGQESGQKANKLPRSEASVLFTSFFSPTILMEVSGFDKPLSPWFWNGRTAVVAFFLFDARVGKIQNSFSFTSWAVVYVNM